MMQIWVTDDNGFFTKCELVKRLESGMITKGWKIALYKPKWNGVEWVEGATEDEIYSINNQKQIDICTEEVKSNKELTEENKLLKEQVKALTEANDFHEELIVEMAALVYA